jgi:hypothetical protein
VDSWQYKGLGADSISKIDTEKAFFILRNAVSHGSIVTRAENPKQKIDRIDFVSLAREHKMQEMRAAIKRRTEGRKLDGLTVDVIGTSPKDFQHFLVLWATWIVNLAGMPRADR